MKKKVIIIVDKIGYMALGALIGNLLALEEYGYVI